MDKMIRFSSCEMCPDFSICPLSKDVPKGEFSNDCPRENAKTLESELASLAFSYTPEQFTEIRAQQYRQKYETPSDSWLA